MITALVRKELRELAPFAILAALVQLYIVAGITRISFGPEWSWWQRYLPTDSESLIPFQSNGGNFEGVFHVGALLGAVVALRQTLWESARGTFHFLLHRPLARTTIFFCKLATGAGLCLLITALPVAYYALWAAAPGTHASPFAWSMTAWAWQRCLVVPLLYFGTFMSGLRPARWFGSRLLPLAGSLLLALILSEIPTTPWQSSIMAAVSLFAIGVWVIGIMHVVRTRDYS